jgi:hypothetical protein
MYQVTHTIPGLFTACLPSGLLCYVAYHLLIKRPMFAILPKAVQRRCASLAARRIGVSPFEILWISLGIVVGAATHVLWDSFGHANQWGTRLIPALNSTALTVHGVALPGYKLVQYGSTVLGLPLLAVVVWRSLRSRPARPLDPRMVLSARGKVIAWLWLGTITLVTALTTAKVRGLSTYHRVGWTVSRAGAALFAATIVFSLVFWAVRATRAVWARLSPAT